MSTSKIKAYKKLELKKHSKLYLIVNKLLKCPYVLIAPAVILALWLTVYPMLFCTYISFQNWDLLTGEMTFVGLKNFKFIFSDATFLRTLSNTIIFMFATVLGGMALKILFGVFLNKDTPSKNLAQTIMFTPHIISSVVISVVFMYLMAPKGGVLNSIIEFFGGRGIGWYLDEHTSLMSIIIITIWQGLGYGVLIVISGLKSIPDYVYEAARLDKSSRVQTFFKITMPLLSPTVFYLLVTSTLSAFTCFDVVKLLTDGGPVNSTSVLAFYIYQQGINFMHYGRAMAASVVLLIITFSLSILNFSIAGKKVHYQ